jgi:cell wall-associated NlpC family hydrolase
MNKPFQVLFSLLLLFSFSRPAWSETQAESSATDLVVSAMGFLDVPYLKGGNGNGGFDCSGFVRFVFRQSLGLVLPRSAAEQAAVTDTISKQDLRPGDLVFFNTMKQAFSHVGIYIGNGKFIHAPRPGEKVRLEDMQKAYWVTRFNGARRVDSLELFLSKF